VASHVDDLRIEALCGARRSKSRYRLFPVDGRRAIDSDDVCTVSHAVPHERRVAHLDLTP
jgi:hypothetical protein